jgi:predicted dehydrogenase
VVVEAAARMGVRFKTGFNLRHHPAIRGARQLAASGAVGNPLFIRCRYGHTGRAEYGLDWRLNPHMTRGGELLDQGVHCIDLFNWFLGDITEVTGFVGSLYWPTQLDDNAFALFRTSQGQIASLHVSWTQWRNLFSFELFGTEGYLIVEGLGGSYGPERLIRGSKAAPHEWPPREVVKEFSSPEECWEDEWAEFLTAILDDREPMGSGAEGLRALELVFAIYEAARCGRLVSVRSEGGGGEKGAGLDGSQGGSPGGSHLP